MSKLSNSTTNLKYKITKELRYRRSSSLTPYISWYFSFFTIYHGPLDYMVRKWKGKSCHFQPSPPTETWQSFLQFSFWCLAFSSSEPNQPLLSAGTTAPIRPLSLRKVPMRPTSTFSFTSCPLTPNRATDISTWAKGSQVTATPCMAASYAGETSPRMCVSNVWQRLASL